MRMFRQLQQDHHSIGEGRIALLGLLTIQAFIGYEWIMSGLTKMIRGGFVEGLADELAEKSEGAAGWYRSFLDDVVFPNPELFGWLILIGELAVGAALIIAAALWLWRWEHLSVSGRKIVLGATALAALGGILMNLNFHFANGSSHPWVVPDDGFDEGVDLDSLMPLLQLVLLVVSTTLLRTLQRGTPT